MSASDALTSVPPVEIMSSTTTAILPSTSPTMWVTSDTSGSGRRLMMTASVDFKRLAKNSARGMQIERYDPLGAGRLQHVRQQLGRDRFAAFRFLVLLGVAIIWNNRGDAV